MNNSPPSPSSPLEYLRSALAVRLVSLTSGGNAPQIDYLSPPGDPGLFGPGAVCWRVHGDFTSMMVGGISALLLQCLHPLAMAGVWDHSNFREDVIGRLRRTATFIAGTTYGSRADAEALLARVRRIHAGVHGTTSDGHPYAASDPALLTWVHVAEVSSFLHSYLRYADPTLPGSEQDRYYSEVSTIATSLGATNVPACRAEVADYLRDMRGELRSDERTREVVRVLRALPAPHPGTRWFGQLLFNAGVDLLPPWAAAMLGLNNLALLRQWVARPGVHAAAPVVRWALRNGVAKRALRRANAPAAPSS